MMSHQPFAVASLIILIIAMGWLLPPGPWQVLGLLVLLLPPSWRWSRRMLPLAPLSWPILTWLLSFLMVYLLGHSLSLAGWLGAPQGWLTQAGLLALLSLCVERLWPAPAGASWRVAIRPWIDAWRTAWAPVRWGLALIALLALGHGVLALLAGITVWDSVVNYLPLVIDQVQEGSLAPPPRHPQDIYAGLLGTTHVLYAAVIALMGSLRGVNLVGWVATAAGWWATVLLARALGAPRLAALVAGAAVFCAPQVVSQAGNTNFDQVPGAIAAIMVWLGVESWRRPAACTLVLTALAQAALPAAKLTGAFWAPVLLVWDAALCWRVWRRQGWRRALILPLAGLCAGLIWLGPLFAWRWAHPANVPMAEHTPVAGIEPRVFAWCARHVQLLAPGELSDLLHAPGDIWGEDRAKSQIWQARDPASGLLLAWMYTWRIPGFTFAEAVTSHLAHARTPDRMWYGVLPWLALLAGAVVLLRGRPQGGRRPRRVVAALALCWLVFTAMYAGFFPMTEFNGRYILAIWFVTAPVLALALAGRRWWGRLAGTALLTAGMYEYGSFLTATAQRDPGILSATPMMEQFARGNRSLNDPLPEARALLDRLEIAEIHYDCWPWYRLQLYDDRLQRRVRWDPSPAETGQPDLAIVTRRLPNDPGAARHRDREYRTTPLIRDLLVDGAAPLLLTPRMVAHPNPHAVIRQGDYALPFGVTGVRVSRTISNHWGKQYWETPKLGAWMGMGSGGRVEIAYSAATAQRLRAVLPIAAWDRRMTPGRFVGLRVQARLGDGRLLAEAPLAMSATTAVLTWSQPAGTATIDLVCAADDGPLGDDAPVFALAEGRLWPVEP